MCIARNLNRNILQLTNIEFSVYNKKNNKTILHSVQTTFAKRIYMHNKLLEYGIVFINIIEYIVLFE